MKRLVALALIFGIAAGIVGYLIGSSRGAAAAESAAVAASSADSRMQDTQQELAASQAALDAARLSLGACIDVLQDAAKFTEAERSQVQELYRRAVSALIEAYHLGEAGNLSEAQGVLRGWAYEWDAERASWQFVDNPVKNWATDSQVDLCLETE